MRGLLSDGSFARIVISEVHVGSLVDADLPKEADRREEIYCPSEKELRAPMTVL
jgi:hypothetical protein